MEIKRFGRTNFMVKRIGFGGMTIPEVSSREAEATLNKALDLGVNFIDTAKAYGDSEERIGYVMKKRRDECYLSSRSPDMSYKGMKKDLENSLRRLRTDYIDLYEPHDVSTTSKFNQLFSENGALKALKEAQGEGKIKSIGFTSHNVELIKRLIKEDEFDAGLIVYNLADTVAEEVIPLAKEYDLGLFVMKVFGNGRLLRLTPSAEQRKPTIEECLSFALSNDNLHLILTGVKSPKEIEENVTIAKEYRPLTVSQEKIIREFGDSLVKGYCYNCSYCLPCPEEINIPKIMQLLETLKRRDWNTVYTNLKREYLRLEKRIKDCIDCEQCEEECPQSLPIRERLKEADEKLS